MPTAPDKASVEQLRSELGARFQRFKVAINILRDHRRRAQRIKSYALTRGRNAVFNISQTANPPTDAINWTPARDSVRYFGIRVGASF